MDFYIQNIIYKKSLYKRDIRRSQKPIILKLDSKSFSYIISRSYIHWKFLYKLTNVDKLLNIHFLLVHINDICIIYHIKISFSRGAHGSL